VIYCKYMIPQMLSLFFWDINTADFDPTSYPEYMIGRILEFGDEHAVACLKETFSEAAIMSVIRTERRLSRRSANYWALVYGIPSTEVTALRTEPLAS
jgi:hypothetical protein